MVLAHTDDERAVLETSHASQYRATAFYGPDLTMSDVPLALTGSLTARARTR